jgi:polyisoprenoid-binding protein YceI
VWVPILLTGLALVSSASADQRTLRIEPATSRASFTLKSTLHTVDGRLTLTRGEIQFDSTTGKASGEVVLDARRTETGNADRDQKMHRKVLESELFPEIVFVPERMSGEVPSTGEGQIELEGAVTVHGASHPVTLAARVTREGDRVHAIAELPIPYLEWGMKDPSVLVLRVAKEVKVALDIEGSLSP